MTDLGTFPHCDMAVLHAPGECKFCDMKPEWQELRKAWGVAFTGKKPEHWEISCPSDFRRGLGQAGKWWHGNRAEAP